MYFFFVPKKNTKYNLCSFFTKNLVSQRTAENFFIIKTTILTLERNLLFHAKIRILLMYSWLEVLIQFFQISNSIRIHFRIRVLLRIEFFYVKKRINKKWTKTWQKNWYHSQYFFLCETRMWERQCIKNETNAPTDRSIFQISFLKDSILRYLQFYAPMQIFEKFSRETTNDNQGTNKRKYFCEFLGGGSVLYDNIDSFSFYTFWFINKAENNRVIYL